MGKPSLANPVPYYARVRVSYCCKESQRNSSSVLFREGWGDNRSDADRVSIRKSDCTNARGH